MLIYIIHLNTINTFRLPKTVGGSYMLNDVDVDNKSRSLINISSNGGKWFFNSNDDVSILWRGKSVGKAELIPYEFYTLKYHNSEYILLYTFPGFIDKYLFEEVAGEGSLIVGKDNKCDIRFNNNNIVEKQLELTYKNGIWNLTNLNPKVPVYVNKSRKETALLSDFDNVFLMGLKLTFIGNKLFVVGPMDLIFLNESLFKNPNLNLTVPDNPIKEVSKEFYSMYDYFYKSPIFRKKYEKYNAIITPPDPKEKNSGTNILSEIIPSALMSLTSFVTLYFSVANYRRSSSVPGATPDNLASNKESLIMSLIMCAVMLITGILWPIIEHFATKLKNFINSRMRVINYKKYLKRKDKEFSNVVTEEKNVLFFNNISLKDCEDAILTKNANLFSRNIESDSFLKFMGGIGRIKSSIVVNYQRPDMIVQNDKLFDDIDKLIDKYKYIDDSCFIFSLKDSLAVIDSTGNYSNYLNAIILQLASLHDYGSLKFVVFTNPTSSLNNIRNLNHCWNNEKTFRYFATDLHEAENVSSELMKIVNKLNKNKVGKIDTYYVIISDCIENYKGIKIIDYVLGNNDPESVKCFSLLMFTNRVNNIPTGCNYFINYSERECSFFNSEMDENNIIKFKPNCLNTSVNFYRDIEALSNIPVKVSVDDAAVGTLPTKLGFLEMYGVGKIEQLNIVERWKNAPISSTLAAPIGIDANGNTLNLDLHEKKHGPHGLIAGMTGSGKSEFIVTYILSLAINYSPDEVQFVLIDYKGGGLAGAFENRKTGLKLPHLVGTITNLDKAEMNRTLVSINSELQRRQKVFNAAKEKLNTGSIDIYKYQMYVRDGSLDEPMSHLFIICDEFAELKAQQPDFMNELVSAARIGRSLGIHLILATQKPAGVVDDQIWSNSKFKVCCKVQTADDSNEMLRKPDAAYIKEAGRFYLQVGYDEYYVLGQSGYSGVQYVPSEMVTTNVDNSVSFIDNNGEVYRNVVNKNENVKSTKNLGEELTNVLKYIIDVAEVQGYKNHQLWLDSIPKRLYYGNLIHKYTNIPISKFIIDPVIGEYDDPGTQSQGYVTLPLTGVGNTIILGNSGSGKSTLFATTMFSTMIRHSSDEVNIYILDFGSEQFNNFKLAPHVGDVITINDHDKVRYFFYMVENELNKRKKYYSDHGGDFQTDISRGSCIFPNMLIFIYGMEVFKETYDEIFDGLFISLTRMSSKFGIEFVIAAAGQDTIGYSIANNFKQKVLLQLTDESDYSYIFKGANVPASAPGRGVIMHEGKPVEFQVALICEEANRKEYLDSMFKKLDTMMPKKAEEVSDVPRKISLDSYLAETKSLDSVPLGVNVLTAQKQYFDFSKQISLLSAASAANTLKFISKLSSLLVHCQNTSLIVLNAKRSVKFSMDEKAKYYESDFDKVNNLLYDNCQKMNKNPSEKNFVILIIGYMAINNHLMKLKQEDDSIHTLDELILESTNNNFKYLIFDEESSFGNLLNSNISELLDNSNGLWIGIDYDGQSAFDMQEIGYSDNPVNPSNELVIDIVDSEPFIIKFPTV